ncbi:helix-turn-helix domain-containing protein [Clostridium oryzae]|uniref:HTH cro/C1-type domain-containing protein n=1 Tax=Clostridium oryzae TaxID=1450648 RepID=A0A1V4IFL2_9CLOT|nr:helix-turn-helix transcriptional regulator [Clostridium oryzae]OPJ58307.1 hypothetical protein CLORY_36700 [Clostridium oryzae]
MSKRISFGDMLGELLAIRGWSASKLAKEINVDASYVRKWIKGTRIPSLKSDYVEKISYYLLKGFNEKSYEKYKHELDYNSDIELGSILSEAQIYSLKEKKKSTFNIILPTEKNELEILLESIPHFAKGREAVFKYTKLIFEAACKNQCVNKDIFMTFQGEKDILDGYENTHGYFLNIISQLLNNNWRLTHLWRLKNNDTRIVRLVSNILSFINTNKAYNPVYFQKYGTIVPPMELIIVGDIAAMLYISDESSDCINSAFFYTDKDEITALREHVLLMFKQTVPLIRYDSFNEDYNNVLNTEGDILLYDSTASLFVECTNNIKDLMLYKIKEILVAENLSETEETLMHLKNILTMVENHENYEVAILDKVPVKQLVPEFMLIKGDSHLYIRSCINKLNIEEPTAVSGFKDYFYNLWDGILLENRDRNHVKCYLRNKIKYLEHKII